MLTERQQDFVRVYRESGDVTAAAVAAGYSPKSARSIGLKLLKQPEIQRALAEAAISVAATRAPPPQPKPAAAAPTAATSPPAAEMPPARPARTAAPPAQPSALSAAAAPAAARPRSAGTARRASEPEQAPPMPLISAPRRPGAAARPPQTSTTGAPVGTAPGGESFLGRSGAAVGRAAQTASERLGPLVSGASARVAAGTKAISRRAAGLIGSRRPAPAAPALPLPERDTSNVATLRPDDGPYSVEAPARTESGMKAAFGTISRTLLGRYAESSDYTPLLKLLLVNCLALFGIFVLWHFGLIQAMLATDQTRISLVIVGIFAATAVHCFYQTAVISRELIVARRVREAVISSDRGIAVVGDELITPSGETLEPSIMTRHIYNLFAKARARGGGRIDQTLLLRSLADQLRSREKLGLFISEALLRLALLGTAVGFILMLIPIAGLSAFDTESLRGTLTGMSGGMAIALNVTVTGIAAALLLKFQYYLLDEAIADLFRNITETTEVHVIPSLDRAPLPAAAAAE